MKVHLTRGGGDQACGEDPTTLVKTPVPMHVKYKETARGGLAVNIIEC
ncbi:hypothetical protein [Streptomyces sindenensis]|nr:hypothetical protein [Streptomyces sindenensis]GGP87057.1 hypothetical protein GCM10010231_66430 [Streptomyces sindenensis]